MSRIAAQGTIRVEANITTATTTTTTTSNPAAMTTTPAPSAVSASNRMQFMQNVSVSVVKPKRLTMKSLTADIVAGAIVEFCADHGDVVTNLRLQKLLYYAQAWFLAFNGKTLFTDPIEAHENGPAIPSVLARFSTFGTGPIMQPLGSWGYPKALTEHIAELMEAYGHLSSYDLERLSREEEPWRQARAHASVGCQFPHVSTDIMRDFYRLRLNAQTAK
jgi:uncharacterized phage-associated protein